MQLQFPLFPLVSVMIKELQYPTKALTVIRIKAKYWLLEARDFRSETESSETQQKHNLLRDLSIYVHIRYYMF